MLTLDKVKKEQICKVVGFCGETDAVSRRFLELGITIGTKIKILSFSLLKKVALLQVRGYVLSVRISLLSKVQVQV